MEPICANDERDSGDKICTEAWILLTIYQTVNRPVSQCKCMVNNLGKGGTREACSFYEFRQGFISFRLFTAVSTAANRPFRRNLFDKWTAPWINNDLIYVVAFCCKSPVTFVEEGKTRVSGERRAPTTTATHVWRRFRVRNEGNREGRECSHHGSTVTHLFWKHRIRTPSWL